MIATDIYPLKQYELDRSADIAQATYCTKISKREEVISHPDFKAVYITYTPQFAIRYGFNKDGSLGSFVIYTDQMIKDQR